MSAILNHDLRSLAKDYRRVKAHNTKWSRGAQPAAGVRCSHNQWPLPSCDECKQRPVRRSTQSYNSLKQAMNQKAIARNNNVTKKSFRSDVVEAVDDVHDNLSDSSADVDIDDTAAAPELKDVMYSFDAPTGPSHGNEILSYAINQAVHRYENNETEKMIKKEYDLVLDGKDEPDSFTAEAEDDFELVDDSHWK